MASLAIVTGASAGIGRATALALARHGVQVVAVARTSAQLASLAAEAPGLIEPITADVTVPADLARLVTAISGRRVDYLLHGAGIFPRGPLAALTAEDWQTAWSANVTSRLQLTLALREQLAGGRVLFIGSDAANAPRAGGAAYSVTQAASAMVWRCCTTELGDTIACALAKPGLVATAMLDASLAASAEQFPARAVYAAMQTRGETISADTVARFFCFLLLEASRTEFTAAPWDIRDAAHHTRWLQGALYRPPHE